MDDRIQTNERAQFAVIGIAAAFALLMVAILVTSDVAPWMWLMLGGPLSLVLGAITRLRRIRRTGRPD